MRNGTLTSDFPPVIFEEVTPEGESIASMRPTMRPFEERGRVLVVEDDVAQAELVSRWLTGAGFEVVCATGVEDGIFLARFADSDLIVADLNLNGGSGVQVAHASREAVPERPVMIMTATPSYEIAVSALRAGVVDFLPKPMEREMFVARCRAALENARPRQATRTVLAIGAHPDDVEIGVGGTLAKHVKAGDRIVIATCSGGENGGVVNSRATEAKTAAQMIGAQLIMGNFPDTKISASDGLIAWLSDIVKTYGPEIVYTHTSRDSHQDHRAVHDATLVATRGVQRVLCYQSPSTLPQFAPTQFADITGFLDTKHALLAAHESQGHRDYMAKDVIHAAARYWGRFSSGTFAEPFEVLRLGA